MNTFCRTLLLVVILSVGSAYGDTWGRYKIVGTFVTDASDGIEGIYFQTVAEQGSDQAAYAVVGGVYPLRVSSVTGAITIPERLEGVPVRKIADGAFAGQTKLSSVTVPASVCEIGDRAFGFCTSLKSVTFKGAGLASVGECCFSNCVSLTSVSFPSSLAYLGPEPFALCDNLASISFAGNAPLLDPPTRDTQVSYLGEKRWTGTAPARATIHVQEGTYGWLAPYGGALPDRWPLSHGYMNAHPVVVETKASRGLSIHVVSREN